MPWVKHPHRGGSKIPKAVQEATRRRILAYAQKRYAGKFARLDIRFRGPFCYIDAYREPDLPPGRPPKVFNETRAQMRERLRNTPLHLCRLRYFAYESKWSVAFFAYSNEKYSPCTFESGSFYGTPEEGFEVGAVYLQN